MQHQIRGAEVGHEDLLRQYLDEISRYPLITDVEEVELARAIEQGEDAAKELNSCEATTPQRRRDLESAVERGCRARRQFIQANLRLVVSVAKRYSWSNVSLLDLIQEGNLGLIRAVERFDYRRGFKFSTYATWWIRQAITRGLADKGRTIRIPVHMVETLYHIRMVEPQLVEELGRDPTAEEIAERTDLTTDRVRDALRARQDPVSLQWPVGDEAAEVGDFIEDAEAEDPFEAAAAALRQDTVTELLDTLAERERRVLALRSGLVTGQPMTLEEVGREFGLTGERIRNIEARALCKLRHPSTGKFRNMVSN